MGSVLRDPRAFGIPRCQNVKVHYISIRYSVQLSILPMSDISQTRKKEASKLTSKERFPAFLSGTVQTYVADAVVAMAVAGGIRTRNVQENLTHPTSRALHLSPIILRHGNSSDPLPWCVRFCGIESPHMSQTPSSALLRARV